MPMFSFFFLLFGEFMSKVFLVLVVIEPYFILQVKIVVFDKTGTLTVGKPAVVSAVLFSNISMEEFCDMAIAAEVRLYFCHHEIQNNAERRSLS